MFISPFVDILQIKIHFFMYNLFHCTTIFLWFYKNKKLTRISQKCCFSPHCQIDHHRQSGASGEGGTQKPPKLNKTRGWVTPPPSLSTDLEKIFRKMLMVFWYFTLGNISLWWMKSCKLEPFAGTHFFSFILKENYQTGLIGSNKGI